MVRDKRLQKLFHIWSILFGVIKLHALTYIFGAVDSENESCWFVVVLCVLADCGW